MTELLEKIKAAGIGYQTDNPLSESSSFRIGGPADLVVTPRSREQLMQTVTFARESGIPYLIVGKGSNVLFPDGGVRGCVIRTSRMDAFSFDGPVLRADAGATLPGLSAACRDRGLSGMEFACGIPGTLGGALIMNAGAYGGEIGTLTRRVYAYHIEKSEICEFSSEKMLFSYRHSLLQDDRGYLILGADLELTPGDRGTIVATMQELTAQRRARQPLDLPSAGSAFKRPEGYFAAKLIDECGLRGHAVGGAQVSEKHTGFIVNRGGATAEDVKELIRQIRERVSEVTGVTLEPEIRIIGEETL